MRQVSVAGGPLLDAIVYQGQQLVVLSGHPSAPAVTGCCEWVQGSLGRLHSRT